MLSDAQGVPRAPHTYISTYGGLPGPLDQDRSCSYSTWWSVFPSLLPTKEKSQMAARAEALAPVISNTTPSATGTLPAILTFARKADPYFSFSHSRVPVSSLRNLNVWRETPIMLKGFSFMEAPESHLTSI